MDDGTLLKAMGAKAPAVSFEIFPPRGELTLEEARSVAAELAALEPAFISVTCSAGGSGRDADTVAVASLIQHEFNVPVVAHVTCQGLTRARLAEVVAQLKAADIENVLALRGDPRDDVPPGDYHHATDLIGPLVDAGFCVGAAVYPEGHISCLTLEEDLPWALAKQEAGASFLVTQLFFDNAYALRFAEALAAEGVTVPVCYGVMPFMSKQQITRMIFTCGASLPAQVVKLLAAHEHDPAALREAGIAYAARQLADLARAGFGHLHVYTMNRPDVARACVRAIRAAAAEEERARP